MLGNGQLCQDSNSDDMIAGIPDPVGNFGRCLRELCSGDIIMAGTPAGCGVAQGSPRSLADTDGIHMGIAGLEFARHRWSMKPGVR